MAFIGTPLDTRNTFQSLQGKRFNGDGSTTAFTLDVAPSSTLDIEVFVGNVRQDPNSAYTLSGTTLTFTGAPPSGTNNIYVVHQAKSVGTIDVPSGGVQAGSLNSAVLTGQTDIGGAIADADLFLVDDGAGGTLRKTAASRIKTYAGFSVSDITGATALDATPADTDEFIISDAGTLKRVDYSYIKGALNTPFIQVYLSSNQTLTNGQFDKITFDSETYDTGSNFASNKFTVPSDGAGYYYIELKVDFDYGTEVPNDKKCKIVLGGSTNLSEGFNNGDGQPYGTVNCSTIVNLSATNYIEGFAYVQNGTASFAKSGSAYTQMKIFKLGS